MTKNIWKVSNVILYLCYQMRGQLNKYCENTMIYLISIPHQMPANLKDFYNEQEIIKYANATADTYIETLEDAKDYLTHDLHSGIWVETQSDVDYAIEYNGHQKFKVRAIAEQIDITTLN